METIKQTQWTVAEIQLIYKSKVKVQDLPQITSSTDAYKILKQAGDDSAIDLYEQFKVMYLNRDNRVVGIYNISSGGVNRTVVDPKLIYTAPLKIKTSSIILSHNHPSGTLVPSGDFLHLFLDREIRRTFFKRLLPFLIVIPIANKFNFHFKIQKRLWIIPEKRP